MTTPPPGEYPVSGDIMDCFFLHLNEATRLPDVLFLDLDEAKKLPDVHVSPNKKRCCFEVLGKRRPVVILYETSRYGDVRWYRVLKATAEGTYRDGTQKPGLIPVPDLGRPDSCVHREPEHYPSNLLDGKHLENGKYLGPLRPERIADLIKCITFYRMGYLFCHRIRGAEGKGDRRGREFGGPTDGTH